MPPVASTVRFSKFATEKIKNFSYCLASSVRMNQIMIRCDSSGKIELSFPFGTTHRVLPTKIPRKQYDIELVRSRWLDIGLGFLGRVYRTSTPSRSWTRKKRTWPVSSHLNLTHLPITHISCLVQVLRHCFYEHNSMTSRPRSANLGHAWLNCAIVAKKLSSIFFLYE